MSAASTTSSAHARPGAANTMSITQTYYLAHKARAKLSREAAQPDHDLRLLVGHANLLDSLMLELADAERKQERWFHHSVHGAAASKPPSRYVQWADRVEAEAHDDHDDDQDVDQDDFAIVRDDDVGNDLEEDYAHLELVRTPSHSGSPPDLMDSDSDSSDDESMPPSPADAALPYNEREAKGDAAADDESLDGREYYMPRRSSAGLVSAISVY